MNFDQLEKELVYEAWEIFHEELKPCPHHGYVTVKLVQIFYGGLSHHRSFSIDVACGGTLLSEALETIPTMTSNHYQIDN